MIMLKDVLIGAGCTLIGLAVSVLGYSGLVGTEVTSIFMIIIGVMFAYFGIAKLLSLIGKKQ